MINNQYKLFKVYTSDTRDSPRVRIMKLLSVNETDGTLTI